MKEIELISSRKNETIRQAAALADSAQLRREQHAYLAEGARLCSDAAQSGVGIRTLFFTAAAAQKYDCYLQPLLCAAQQSFMVEEHVALLLSATKTSQGIYAVCEMGSNLRPVQQLPDRGRFAALENVQDPANLGAVLRTAEALGTDGVLLCGACCDLYAPKTLRSAMGAVFRVPVYREENVRTVFEILGEKAYTAYAAVPDSAATPLPQVCFGEKAVVFIGNEGNGLTQQAISGCTGRITIPMRGRAESLNASASASILLWELAK